MNRCPLCDQEYKGHKGIYVDTYESEIIIDGRRLKLTRKQTELLAILIRISPRIARKEFLMDCMYGMAPEVDEPNQKIVDVFVCRIREQLVPTRFRIETVWGSGYRLREKDGQIKKQRRSGENNLTHLDDNLPSGLGESRRSHI